MSDVTIIGPDNAVIYSRSFSANENPHLHLYLTANAPPPVALPKKGDEGIDLSSNNDCQDGPKLVEAGKRWGYARITMGATGVDRRWKYHRAIYRLADMLDGGYHLLIHNIAAKDQHENFVGQMKADCGPLPPVVDVERREMDKAPGLVNKSAFTILLYDWLRRCEDTWHCKPIIYTNLPEWLAMTTEPDWAREYKFFAAQYNKVLNSVHPSWNVWAWQYAVKPIPSINKERAIDHDRWLGQSAPTPGARHNFAPRTNQDVINLFKSVTPDFIAWLTRAGLLASLGAARLAAYSGPDVEELPLTDAEKAALMGAMG